MNFLVLTRNVQNYPTAPDFENLLFEIKSF